MEMFAKYAKPPSTALTDHYWNEKNVPTELSVLEIGP